MNSDELLAAFYHHVEAAFGVRADTPPAVTTAVLTSFDASKIIAGSAAAQALSAPGFLPAAQPGKITYDLVQPTILSAEVGLVTSVLKVQGTREEQPGVPAELRVSAVFHRGDNGWQLAHVHTSVPHSQPGSGSSDDLSLQEVVAKLERSNRDLQHFAYAASHDLQEPLRMVTSFLDLLRRRYQEELDEEAQMFINFALDGAQRMRLLINGLLNYARVDTRGQPFTAVDMNKLFDEITSNVQVSLAEANGRLHKINSLPIVLGDRGQLLQLLQNIVGNALKYRGTERLLIEVNYQPENGYYHFTVKDNGMGIDSRHHERIFVIFQRLHTNEEIAGSGIGLAVCKRIVDRHNGRIWVESEAGRGATFHFTLPAWQPAAAKTTPLPLA